MNQQIDLDHLASVAENTFSSVSNPTFLQACLHQATPYTPVWLMRQAGRYLSQYRAIREKAGSFMALAQNPELACEATLQPLDLFNLDAAILFSDILTVPDAMGLGLSFVAGEGPRFMHPVRTECDVEKLCVPPMEKLAYVFNAIETIKKNLLLSNGQSKIPLIGFSGSPWTLACYMVEGASSRDYFTIKHMLYRRPDLLHQILTVTSNAVIDYLNYQIDSGVNAVMLFDSWGGVLTDSAFKTFSLSYTQYVLRHLKRINGHAQTIPRIVFTKGGAHWLEDQTQLACDVLGVDWTCNLQKARAIVAPEGAKHPKALQGNLDPQVLLADKAVIEQEAIAVLDRFGQPLINKDVGATHIFNLGHGIDQHTPPEHVSHLVNVVHEHSQKMRHA